MPPQNNNSTVRKSDHRLMAADFFSHTLKAFLIGVGASVVLSGAVILLAQSTAQYDGNLIDKPSETSKAP